MYLFAVTMVLGALIAYCFIALVENLIARKKRFLIHFETSMHFRLKKENSRLDAWSIYEAPLGCLELDRLESSRKSLAAAQKIHKEVNHRMKKVKNIANIICFSLILMLSILVILLVAFITLLTVSILN